MIFCNEFYNTVLTNTQLLTLNVYLQYLWSMLEMFLTMTSYLYSIKLTFENQVQV